MNTSHPSKSAGAPVTHATGTESRIRPVVGLSVFVMLLATLWLGWVRLNQHPAAPSAPIELTLQELIRRDGRLYRTNGVKPFSGALIARYPDGSLLSRSMVSEGRLDGVSEGFYTNGVVQVRETFADGVSSGMRTKWHPNGGKLSEGMIVDGEFHGVFRRWHENGALAERVEMVHGKPNGLAEAFYPSSFVKTRATLREGKMLSKQEWRDGEQKQSQASPTLSN